MSARTLDPHRPPATERAYRHTDGACLCEPLTRLVGDGFRGLDEVVSS